MSLLRKLVNGGGGGGGLALIERKVVSADTQLVTFSDLDGDLDGVYIMRFWLKPTTISSQFLCRPNGDSLGSGNYSFMGPTIPISTISGSNKTTAFTGALLHGVTTPDVGFGLIGECRIHAVAEAGMSRPIFTEAMGDSGSDVLDYGSGIAAWRDSGGGGKVTSVVLFASVADQIKQNSVIKLYKEVYS